MPCLTKPAWTQRVVLGIDELDQVREIVCGSDLQLEQLRGGDLKSRFVRSNLGPVTFDSAKYSLPVRAAGCGGANTLSFVLVRSPVVFNQEHLQPGDIVLYPAGAEFEGFAKSSFSDYVFTIDPHVLARFAEAIGSDADLARTNRFSKLCRSPAASSRLDRIGAQLDRAAPASAKTSAEVASSIMSCLCDLLTTKPLIGQPRPASYRRSHLIRAAEPYLIRQSEERSALGLICSQLNVSSRTLQMAFAAVTGLAPSEYGRVLRLHAVRRELRQLGPSVTVTEVALRHSFTHLGRFSAYYRDLFGEFPSETLRNLSAQVRTQ